MAQEVCLWLQDQGHVQHMEEGALGIRAGSVKEAMAPPPLHRIAVAKIDQLPIGLVLVLRYASTIGVTFDAALLQDLVELEDMATPQQLQQQLTTLSELPAHHSRARQWSCTILQYERRGAGDAARHVAGKAITSRNAWLP